MVDTDKNKRSIYIDVHKRSNVVAYRNQFCDQWHNRYLPRILYFEGVDMNRVKPKLKAGEMEIVAVFHGKLYSEQMKISSFFS